MSSKVGVVIPSYNQGKYLEAAIKSVIANKKNANIEVAIIDGGSDDETVSIIRKYENEISMWCSEPDGGQAAAINKGIKALWSCDYFMWLNSDDVYEDEYSIKKIIEFAENGGYDVCYGLSHFINENGENIGEYPVEEYDYRKLGKRCFLSQPSVIFSKKAYQETGPINERLHMCLDYEYWIRLAQKYNFYFLKEYIGSTRMYQATKTSTMQERHLNEAICILMKYYKNVPIHWIVTKVMADHPCIWWKYIPKRFLFPVCFPMKKYIINKCLKGVSDD